MDLRKFPQALTFDDILLSPGYSDFSRGDINLSTKLTRSITLRTPLVASPMDTVTESKLAIALAQMGGIGFIHRNLTPSDQADQVAKVKTHSTSSGQALLVGAAVGASKGFEDRIKVLVKANVDVVVIDSAHGYSLPVMTTLRWIKKKYPKLQVIAGNISTFDGARALIEAGADGLRVGMGPGAICTTRVISGMGVPQVTALLDTVRAATKDLPAGRQVPVIADGGIKHSGDMVKALATGASTVMMGSFFASSEESPGDVVELTADQVPSRFKSISKCGGKCEQVLNHKHIYKFKAYRGMGSIGAMKQGTKIKSEDEFHGKSYYKDRVLVAEGVEGLVPVKGTVKELVEQSLGGIKSGMYYVGAKSIKELWKKAEFIQITQASLTESHPHDILITNPGGNY